MFVDFINEGKFIYFYSLQQVTDSIATFKGSFDYRSFPLDRQTLRFDFQNRDQRGLMYFYEYTDGYKNGFNNLELYEWKKTNFEMDLIRDAMKKRKLATERLHEDYRKMYKNHQFAY